MSRLRLILTALALLAAPAHADPVVLRMASIAPDGTGWARELKAFARDVEAGSHGQLKIKWYLGGIAGDESQVPERIRKGQLDGEAAAITCARLAPSLKVLRVVGLFRRREEANYVLSRLQPTIAHEFARAGYTLLGVTWFGSDIIFSRRPIRTFDDLRRTRFWVWSLDDVWGAEMRALGFDVLPLPVEAASRAYEEGRVDGFLALPTAALAFQWSARSHYFTRLPLALMAGCSTVSNRAFDALPLASQAALRAAAAKLTVRFAEVSASQEDALLDGLFARQGTRPVAPSDTLRSRFLEAARDARQSLPEQVVPKALLSQVLDWLADYRSDHH